MPIHRIRRFRPIQCNFWSRGRDWLLLWPMFWCTQIGYISESREGSLTCWTLSTRCGRHLIWWFSWLWAGIRTRDLNMVASQNSISTHLTPLVWTFSFHPQSCESFQRMKDVNPVAKVSIGPVIDSETIWDVVSQSKEVLQIDDLLEHLEQDTPISTEAAISNSKIRDLQALSHLVFHLCE